MSESAPQLNFDMQTAWLRRFTADAESNLKAFALRLKEALPGHVTILEKKPFLFGEPKFTGVSADMGEQRYLLEIVNGRLQANVAMIVRGITLNTKRLDPAEWFAKLSAEAQKSTEYARSLSESLSGFMLS